MTLVEKRDFIHNHLHQVDEKLINEFYEMMCREEILRSKLINRAEKSEHDILNGKIFLRAEVEQRTNKIVR